MSNIPIKIIILLLTFIGVVTFILVYIEAVAPPKGVTLSNEHYESAEEDVNNISSLKVEDYDHLVYYRVLRKLEIYKMESFISEQEYELLETSFVKNYVPVFYTFCQNYFLKNDWKRNDLDSMRVRVKYLRPLMSRITDVDDNSKAKLDSIMMVIDAYGKAWRLVREAKHMEESGNFISVSDAKEKIKKAKSYRSQNPLKNCKSLVVELGNVKKNVAEAHYKSLEEKVEGLRKYDEMTEEEYNSLAVNVNIQINEYKNNISEYAVEDDSYVLIDKAEEIYKEGERYYTQKRERERNMWLY